MKGNNNKIVEKTKQNTMQKKIDQNSNKFYRL